MSLATPEKIEMLQRKLYAKAKAEPDFRFYLLYDKVYRADILSHAYALAKANKGAAGVDGVTFETIEAEGLEEWLARLGEELRGRTYRPQPVRRVMIPKPGGGERPLGIPTIRDRVVQTAAKLVLEPIFEADLDPESYGYRPGRSAVDAVRGVHGHLKAGYTDVVDADLSKYFGAPGDRQEADGSGFQLWRKTIRKRLKAKVRAVKEELRRHVHASIDEQGRWLGSVMRGYFAYHAVPTNLMAISAFRHHIIVRWLRVLRRRSQRHRMTWVRMQRIVDRYLPKACVLHPWPDERFRVTHSR